MGQVSSSYQTPLGTLKINYDIKFESSVEKAQADETPNEPEGGPQDEDYKDFGPCNDVIVALGKCVGDAYKNEKWVEKELCLDAGIAVAKCVEANLDYWVEEDEK